MREMLILRARPGLPPRVEKIANLRKRKFVCKRVKASGNLTAALKQKRDFCRPLLALLNVDSLLPWTSGISL